MIVIKITNSQRMALADIIAEHMAHSEMTEVFIDFSQEPAVETTPGELLSVVLGAKEEP